MDSFLRSFTIFISTSLLPFFLSAKTDTAVIEFHYYTSPYPNETDSKIYTTINGTEDYIDTFCVGDVFHVKTVWDNKGIMSLADSTSQESTYWVTCGADVDSFYSHEFYYRVPDTGLVVIECRNVCLFRFPSPIVVVGLYGPVNYFTCSYHSGIGLISYYCTPTANFTTSGNKICTPHCLQVTDLSENAPQEWRWHFEGAMPEYFSGKTPPPVCYDAPGTYSIELIVQNVAGADTLIDSLQVYEGATPNITEQYFTVLEGSSVTLQACAIGKVYEWKHLGETISNVQAVTVHPNESMEITLRVSSDSACFSLCDYGIILVDGLLLPTAFSPNGDGINDFFRILNANITLKNFEVYNRWGELVFKTSDIQTGWDGVYKGTEQELGTYVWLADYVVTKNGKRKSAKGNVTLLR